MKRIWVALLVFSILGGSVSANAISFKRKKSKKKESIEKEKTAYDNCSHLIIQKQKVLSLYIK